MSLTWTAVWKPGKRQAFRPTDAGSRSKERSYNTIGPEGPPLRAWYNADVSPFSYSDQLDSGVVLEVGLLNYEMSLGYFTIQVVMKVVDPKTGVVIANARKFSNNRFDDIDSLFEDDAAAYKQLFREITAELVQGCIDKLGLNLP